MKPTPSFNSNPKMSSRLSKLLVNASCVSAMVFLSPNAFAAVSITGFFLSQNPVLEGSFAFLSINVTSSRILDGFSGSVSWGDSLSSGAGGFSGTTVGHGYVDDGVFTIAFNGTGYEYTSGFFGSNYSNSISAGTSITVQNVAPTIVLAPTDQSLDLSQVSLLNFSASATDPGTADVLTYSWDLDGDGQYDDFTGASGQFDFSSYQNGIYGLAVQVGDGDGGFDTQSFNLNIVPEPSAFTLIALAGIGIVMRRRRA
jgi:PKD domain